MAKVAYTEKSKPGGALEYVEAVYDGKIHHIQVYGGDTRTEAEKLAAIKACLFLRANDLAIKDGKPIPDPD